MKKIKFFSALVAIVLSTYATSDAQTIKTYNGPIEKPKKMISSLWAYETLKNVTYQYYEDEDGARVWHGTFSVPEARAVWGANFYRDVKLSGKYEDGKQVGLWVETDKDQQSNGVISTLKYNFESGKLNGSYSCIIYEGSSAKRQITTSFIDNKFAGSFDLTRDIVGFSVKGQFNEQGLATGEWVVKYQNSNKIQFVRKYTYDNGVAMRIIEIDNSTGEKTVLREASKSEKYGTIIIDGHHYKAMRTDEIDDVRAYIELRSNDVGYNSGLLSIEGLYEGFRKFVPLVNDVAYLPFMGLKNWDYKVEELEAEAKRKVEQEELKAKEESLKLEMEKDDYIFEEVEEMPKFNNGDINTFVKWVYSNLQYPKYAQDNGITGIVIFSFIVESDGTLSNVEILRSPDESLSNEVLRVIKLSPKLTSGVRNGRAVRVKQQAGVRFVGQ